jgi:hypothetical protein
MLTLTVLPQEQHEALLAKIERLERLIQLVASRDELNALLQATDETFVDLANTAKDVDLYLGEQITGLSGKIEHVEQILQQRQTNLALALVNRFEEVYARMGVRRIEDKLKPGKFILCPIAPKTPKAKAKKRKR